MTSYDYMKITSYRNNSPRHGWAAIGLSILFIVVTEYFGPMGSSLDTGLFDIGPSGIRRVLQVFSIIFFIGGLWILIWSPKRTVTLHTGSRQVVINDTSLFGRKTRHIPFASIAKVAMDDWKDPDPDIRPFKACLYWVALHLHTGETVEITDRSQQRGEISRIMADVIEHIK